MENKGNINPQDIQIQGIIDNFLRFKTLNNSGISQQQHLDDDSLAAFVEGNLSEREAKPMLGHLVNCSFCRHITAELIKLDFALAEVDEVRPTLIENAEPSKISSVLSGLLAKIFGSNDGAVFAHEEKEEDSEKNKEPEKD